MTPNDVLRQLEDIAATDDFAARSLDLVEEWSRSASACDVVEPILQFMERHPALDFGMPGPLVHCAERFYGRGYEAKLLDSIGRRPTACTVWMLIRVINGTREPGVRHQYLEILNGVRDNPAVDATARRVARQYLISPLE